MAWALKQITIESGGNPLAPCPRPGWRTATFRGLFQIWYRHSGANLFNGGTNTMVAEQMYWRSGTAPW